jgi:hypothetical protein
VALDAWLVAASMVCVASVLCGVYLFAADGVSWYACMRVPAHLAFGSLGPFIPACACVTVGSLQLLCRQSHPSQAATVLAELIDSLDRHEPKNAALYFRIAQPFARLAGRSRQIIELTMAIIERARVIEPLNSLYVTEIGYGWPQG